MSEQKSRSEFQGDDENTVQYQLKTLSFKLELAAEALRKLKHDTAGSFRAAEILNETSREVSQTRCNVVSILEGGKIR